MATVSAIDTEVLTSVIRETLTVLPPAPLMCLPMSAFLYAKLCDENGHNAALMTGNLFFGGDLLFKQDFSVDGAQTDELKDWGGHAWVEVGGLICDLSFFRTLYSGEFNRPYKTALIETFGTRRGALVGTAEQLQQDGFTYQGIDRLKDETATGIIKGIEHLPVWNKP